MPSHARGLTRAGRRARKGDKERGRLNPPNEPGPPAPVLAPPNSVALFGPAGGFFTARWIVSRLGPGRSAFRGSQNQVPIRSVPDPSRGSGKPRRLRPRSMRRPGCSRRARNRAPVVPALVQVAQNLAMTRTAPDSPARASAWRARLCQRHKQAAPSPGATRPLVQRDPPPGRRLPHPGGSSKVVPPAFSSATEASSAPSARPRPYRSRAAHAVVERNHRNSLSSAVLNVHIFQTLLQNMGVALPGNRRRMRLEIIMSAAAKPIRCRSSWWVPVGGALAAPLTGRRCHDAGQREASLNFNVRPTP